MLAVQVVTRVPPLGHVPVSVEKQRQRLLVWQHIGHAAGLELSHVVSVPVPPVMHAHAPCVRSHAASAPRQPHDELGSAGQLPSAQHTSVALAAAGHFVAFAAD